MVPLAMKSLCHDQVRRFFYKCRKYEILYRALSDYDEIIKFEKRLSHRSHISASSTLEELAVKYSIDPGAFYNACGCSDCIAASGKVEPFLLLFKS